MAEIRGDESVFGSFIHHPTIGMVFNDLPTVFRLEKLTTYVSHIRRFFLLGESDGGFQGMEFSYGEMLIVSRPINNDYLLVTFCSPDANSQSIHLQQKVLLPELWTAIGSKPAPSRVRQKEKPVAKAAKPVVKAEQPVVKEKKKETLLFRGVSYEV